MINRSFYSFLTLEKAKSMTFFLYLQSKSQSCSCFSLIEKLSSLLQILFRRYAREKGIFLHTWEGWQEVGRRYWFAAVGLTYKSEFSVPPEIWISVSKNAVDLVVKLVSHLNWMFALTSFSTSRNSSNSSFDPCHKRKTSSK